MPKYVFEVSAILPAEATVGQMEANVIAVYLEAQLEKWLAKTHPGVPVEVSHDDPFEHVTGDWLPPDETGATKLAKSRPIDL